MVCNRQTLIHRTFPTTARGPKNLRVNKRSSKMKATQTFLHNYLKQYLLTFFTKFVTTCKKSTLLAALFSRCSYFKKHRVGLITPVFGNDFQKQIQLSAFFLNLYLHAKEQAY